MKLKTKAFLNLVCPSTGFIYVVHKTPRGMRHRACLSADQIESYVKKLLGKGAKDIYFTPNSFDTDYVPAGNGHKKNARTQDHMAWGGAYFIDLDCGEGKPYKTKSDAGRAFLAFKKKTGIPTPNIIVDSGGGLHIYWALSDLVPPDLWQQQAEKLKAFCLSNGLYIDPAPTADAARIMRLPGTDNHKQSKPRPCFVVENAEKVILLSSHMEKFLSGVTGPSRATAHIADNDDLTAGVGDTRPSFTENIVERCELLKHIRDTHGKGCDEPTWMSTLQLVHFTEDGDSWIHKLSDGHPDYSSAATEEKYAQRGKKGPTTCQQFSEVSGSCGIKKCTTCAYNGKIKTPYVLGKDNAPEPEPEVFPPGYNLRSDGVYREKKQKNGDVTMQRVISLHFLTLEVLEQHAEGGLWVTTFAFEYVLGKRRKAQIQDQELRDNASTLGALAFQRIALDPDQATEFRKFMNAWVTELRRANQTKTAAASYGWQRQKSEITGFAIGGTVFNVDGTEHHSVRQTHNFSSVYAEQGSREPWDKAVNFLVKQNRQELMALMASSFAAPLFDIVGISGAVLSACSRSSGVGKTSALKCAQAVWGDPISGVNAVNDTQLSVAKKLGVLNNLPVFWDEIRIRENIKGFVQLMFQLGQGKERSRLNSGTGFQEMGVWKTLIVAASNEPLLEHAEEMANGSNAAVMRLLEYHVENVADAAGTNNMRITQLFSALEHNYGHAGRVYGKWLSLNRTLLEQAMDKLSKSVETDLQTKKDERFWVATVVCMLLGATVAKKLGLVDFDLVALKKFLYNVVRDMRGNMTDTVRNLSPEEALASFVRLSQGLYTDTLLPPGNPKVVAPVKLLRPVNDSRPIAFQHAEQAGILRVPKKELRAFLGKQQINYNGLIKQYHAKGVCKSVRANLGAGTMHRTPREWCFDFYLVKMGLT